MPRGFRSIMEIDSRRVEHRRCFRRSRRGMHVKNGARSRGLNVESRVLDVGAQNNIPADLIYESRPGKSEEESTTVYQRSSLSIGQRDTECRKRKERVSRFLRSTSGYTRREESYEECQKGAGPKSERKRRIPGWRMDTEKTDSP